MTLEKAFKFLGEPIRIAGTAENPLFCAVDVCAVLGISNSRAAIGSLDDDEKATVALSDTSSSTRKTIPMQVVTELNARAEAFDEAAAMLEAEWAGSGANMELGDMAVWAATRVHVGQYAGCAIGSVPVEGIMRLIDLWLPNAQRIHEPCREDLNPIHALQAARKVLEAQSH